MLKIILPLIFASVLLFGDDDSSVYDIFSTSPDGAALFRDNCLGCHQAGDFLPNIPKNVYVLDLIEDIDYNIYAPDTGMDFLSFLKTSEIEEIARFLIFGKEYESRKHVEEDVLNKINEDL